MRIAPLLGSTLSTDESFAIAEWTDPGCPADGPMPVAPLHLHEACDEAWIVLEGRLVVRVGDEPMEIGPGEAILVPRGTPHTYWNPAPEPCRYLLVMTARTRRLIDAIHAASDRRPEAMRALFAAHGAKLL